MQFANAVAALKCRDLGARTALPDRGALTEFLEDNAVLSPKRKLGQD